MLEVSTHHHLKKLLQNSAEPWPHNLTFSRLVARSLRRHENSLIQFEGDQNCWWVGLLIPLCLESLDVVLVLSARQRQRLFEVELPRLKQAGLSLSYWGGSKAPSDGQVWIIDHCGLINAFQLGLLASKHLIIPEADSLVSGLRDVMTIEITSKDWENLRQAHPLVDDALMQLYEQLSRKLFSHASCIDARVRMDCSEIVSLKDLIGLVTPSPAPWSELFRFDAHSWASWAVLDHKTLTWTWKVKPLEPLESLKGLLSEHPLLLLAGAAKNSLLLSELDSVGCQFDLKVKLGRALLQEPISLYAPQSQPLPNTECYAKHLLDQSRRLIFGLAGITILLLDDKQLRQQLTSELAAEFGRRVVHEKVTSVVNGVVCCRWSWWLEHQDYFPIPDQLIVAALPLASIEDPLIAARVAALKRQGRDWFRELLLPEALNLFPRAVAPLRVSQGRSEEHTAGWGSGFCSSALPWHTRNGGTA